MVSRELSYFFHKGSVICLFDEILYNYYLQYDMKVKGGGELMATLRIPVKQNILKWV